MATGSPGKFIPRPGMAQPTAPPKPNPLTTPNPAGYTQSPTGNSGPGGLGTAGGGYSATPGAAPVPGVSPTGKTWNVDPTGMATPYTPTPDMLGGGTNWNAGNPTDLFALGQDRFLSLLRGLKGEGGLGGPVGMNREPGLTLTPRETPSTMADREPAEIAGFARAKDRLGKIAGGAMTSLKDAATAGGRAGSGLEGGDMRAITGGLQTALGEVVRDQTIDKLGRHDEIDDRNLNAGITMRGQDQGASATEYGGNIQQRGQDFQGAMNDPTRQMIMSMLPQFMSAMNFMPRY